MNFNKYHVSKNLFDKDNVTHDTLSADGSISHSNAMDLSGLIAVDGDFTVSWNAVINGAYMRVSTYDENKNFIKRIAAINTYSNSSYTNSHIGYIRINYENDLQLSQVQVNLGSEALPYEPYSSEVWHDIPHYIHNTSTDTITTLPADVYADGQSATVELKGNMQQTGTPTPQNPIQPQETGERTANLWNESYTGIKTDVITYLPLNVGGGDYTLSSTVTVEGQAAVLFLLAGNVSSGATTVDNGVWNGQSRTVAAVDGYITIGYRKYPTVNPENANTMLNLGSTAKPYEPYGYKIPISSANITTPVYLGEVESTRKIKKVVFKGDGTENWGYSSSKNNARVYLAGDSMAESPSISTHYQFGAIRTYPNLNEYCINNASALVIGVDKNSITSAADFKAYLAQQYAAGTPVTVWYVLATPTTGIVNEPLRKIGDYADEVSGITIPTITGADTLSVDTTLQPSEVTVNYKGWHPVSDVHERESGAWT